MLLKRTWVQDLSHPHQVALTCLQLCLPYNQHPALVSLGICTYVCIHRYTQIHINKINFKKYSSDIVNRISLPTRESWIQCTVCCWPIPNITHWKCNTASPWDERFGEVVSAWQCKGQTCSTSQTYFNVRTKSIQTWETMFTYYSFCSRHYNWAFITSIQNCTSDIEYYFTKKLKIHMS